MVSAADFHYKKTMNSLGVFCGGSIPNSPAIVNQADELGEYLAKNGITLVYGGAKKGLMGVMSKSCMDNGGEVVGILPRFMAELDIAHLTISKLHNVNSFHARRLKFSKLSDAFLFLPGGFGTLRDFTDLLMLRKMNIIAHPLAYWSVEGHFDPIQGVYDHMKQMKLVDDELRDYVYVDNDLDKIMNFLKREAKNKITRESATERL